MNTHPLEIMGPEHDHGHERRSTPRHAPGRNDTRTDMNDHRNTPTDMKMDMRHVGMEAGMSTAAGPVAPLVDARMHMARPHERAHEDMAPATRR